MFNRVLVGIDDQSHGSDAVQLACRLLSPSGRMIFGHVLTGDSTRESRPATTAGSAAASVGATWATEEGAQLLLASIAGHSQLDAETCVVEADRIGAGLHRLAERTGADLLVIGSSREGQNGRVWLRDGVRTAINGAPCAVAVAPLEYAELGTPITQIGIAYNGSSESRTALAVGRALAADLGANAVAFQALARPAWEAGAPSAEMLASSIRAFEDEARDRLAAQTGVCACASCGETVQELSVFSGSVDLLVLGSRDYGPVGRLVHGSTTSRLLGYARSPLLILTRAARAQVEQYGALVGGMVAA